MQNSNFTIAEMADTADYAAMNYGELLRTKLAFTGAVGLQINPLLEEKRLYEMANITHIYMTAMNAYEATRSEILTCLEAEGMKESRMFTHTQDVDDQTSTMNVDDNQNKGETVLALPEPSLMSTTEIMETESAEGSKDEGQNKDVAQDSDQKGYADNEGIETLPSEVVSLTGPADVKTTPPSLLVDAAIKTAKRGRIPNEIDVNGPYFVRYTIKYDDNGNLCLDGKSGRNLDKKDLEEFRAAAEKHHKLFRKEEIMMSTDDCLVYREDEKTIKVIFYHFIESSGDGVESIKPKEASYSNRIPDDLTVDLHKTHRRMKRAIEKAMKFSASIGSSNSPYYEKYIFYDNGVNVTLNSNPERVSEDENTLIEIKAAFETYAKFYTDGVVLISEENCVVVKVGKDLYVLLFNFPSQAKVSAPAKRRRSKAVKETESFIDEVKVVESAGSSDVLTDDETDKDITLDAKEQDIVDRAVEMTKSLQVGNGTDANNPYFIQCEFSIVGDGALILKGKPFSKNVSDKQELVKLRRNHSRFAKTMKAINPVSTDNYTAYVWNEGKNLSVFYYNTRGLADAA